jgi:hypothetical protein
MTASLLEGVRGLLERTYRMRSGLAELDSFLIGDRGYRQFFAELTEPGGPGSAAGDGARTLLREVGGSLRASIYYPDSLIRCLEAFPPQCGLGSENVDAFATFVEEIDHLLFVAERFRLERPLSLLELELHADVSKHLVLSRFLAGPRQRLEGDEQAWLRHCLFARSRHDERDPHSRERYRQAARWAVRLLDGTAKLSRASRLETLRRFHAAELSGKIALIDRVAA